ncbi:metallophosphoesterase family protein [Thiomonas sp.]
MRLAIVSDIHGNLPALDAVLADIARRGAELSRKRRAAPSFLDPLGGPDANAAGLGVLTVNCGDLLSGPLWPHETAERLMALNLPTIAGNHERQLLACAQGPGGASDQYAFEHTTQTQRDWLAALPARLEPLPGVLMVHGRPDSDLEYLLETVDAAEPAGVRAATPDEVRTRCAGIDAELLVCGHSHHPAVMQLPGGPLVVNAGSVGLQAYDDDHGGLHWIRNGSPHARYALCERSERGRWQVALIAVDYDWSAAAAQARRNGAADWAGWLETGWAAAAQS